MLHTEDDQDQPCHWPITGVFREDNGLGPAVSRGWRAQGIEEPRVRGQRVPTEISWVNRLQLGCLAEHPALGPQNARGQVSHCPCVSISSSVK